MCAIPSCTYSSFNDAETSTATPCGHVSVPELPTLRLSLSLSPSIINTNNATSKLHFFIHYSSQHRFSISCYLLLNARFEGNWKKKKMGCGASMYPAGERKNKSVPEVVVYVPSMRIPAQSDLQRTLRGLIPQDLVDRLACLRNQIVLVAEDTGGSDVAELRRALDEYLPLLVGLTKKEHGLEGSVEFKWKNLESGRQENSVANSFFELLSVIHMIAMLNLSEANRLMIPEDRSGSGIRVVSSDCKREAVDLLLKASGCLVFCVREILAHLPPDIKKTISKDFQDGVLEAISIQALGQGTEIQLGFAVESQKASLSVKRRLACEQMIYFGQAYHFLSELDMSNGHGKKHLCFIKWKFLEAKGTEPACHVSAVCCFLAAVGFCQRAEGLLNLFLADPVTRSPPLWGAMKHLHQKFLKLHQGSLRCMATLEEEK
ncbi:BRO1 domain-containing protein [Salix suchowensis]|nr:BRO1 domain-containing protein [Salix suchowensis]